MKTDEISEKMPMEQFKMNKQGDSILMSSDVSNSGSEEDEIKLPPDEAVAEAKNDDEKKNEVELAEEPLERGVYGIVKWYNVKFQYGFITRLDSKKDIFVHKNGIKRSDRTRIKSIADGEVVMFDVFKADKGVEARNLTGPEGKPAKASVHAALKAPVAVIRNNANIMNANQLEGNNLRFQPYNFGQNRAPFYQNLPLRGANNYRGVNMGYGMNYMRRTLGNIIGNRPLNAVPYQPYRGAYNDKINENVNVLQPVSVNVNKSEKVKPAEKEEVNDVKDIAAKINLKKGKKSKKSKVVEKIYYVISNGESGKSPEEIAKMLKENKNEDKENVPTKDSFNPPSSVTSEGLVLKPIKLSK